MVNNTIKKEENEINIGFLIGALLKKLWLILIVTVLAAALMFVYSRFFITPLYSSTTKLYVNNRNNNNTGGYISSTEITAARELIKTYIAILETPDTLQIVIDEMVKAEPDLDGKYSAAQLMKMIDSGSVNDTELFYVTVSAPDPEEARLIASKIAEVLPKRIPDIIDGSTVSVAQTAVAPNAPASPNVTKNTLLGAFMGFIATCLVIVVLELIDNTIHDSDYASDTYGVHTLASIPDVTDATADAYDSKMRGKNKKKLPWIGRSKSIVVQDKFIPCDKLPFRVTEAYKMLRTSVLNISESREGCSVIGITSPNPSEGKSTLAINLSYTLAQANKKVLLIEADLRKPVFAKRLKISPSVGLSEMLNGEREGAIQTSSYFENWKIICAGKGGAVASELLGSLEMEVLITELRSEFDHIIIDLPPVNEVTDAVAVSGCLDGMLLVVKESVTTKMDLEIAMSHLTFSKAELLGFIITNSASDSKRSIYGKYKRYSSYYGYGN